MSRVQLVTGVYELEETLEPEQMQAMTPELRQVWA